MILIKVGGNTLRSRWWLSNSTWPCTRGHLTSKNEFLDSKQYHHFDEVNYATQYNLKFFLSKMILFLFLTLTEHSHITSTNEEEWVKNTEILCFSHAKTTKIVDKKGWVLSQRWHSEMSSFSVASTPVSTNLFIFKKRYDTPRWLFQA